MRLRLTKGHLVLLLIVFCLGASFGEENFEAAEFKSEAQYYGPPLLIRGGYFYRKNNFSVFPNAGAGFAPSDIISGDVFSSLALTYGNLKLEPSFHYELFSSDIREKDERQIYYAQNKIEYGFKAGGAFLLTKYGKKRWNEYQGEEISALQILDTLDLGIGLHLFLFDSGLFRGDIKSFVSYNHIPGSRFNSYDIRIDVPVTLSLYYADIGVIYTNYYTDALDFYRGESGGEYVIEKTYSYITGRYGFPGSKSRYKLINSLELENRWYFLRGLSPASNVFVSVFGGLGFGIDRAGSPALLGQAGFGVGYMLFDCAPFTFQAGFDTGRNPVFYLGVVSRISHF
jgi:hypothetical protein